MDIEKPTKKKLNQVYYLTREIENLQQIIDKSDAADLRSPVTDGMPHSATNVPGKPTETTAIKLADLRDQIEDLQSKCKQAKQEIMSYVMSMNDSYMRQIVIMRCMELMSWREVAEHIGGNNTAETCRQAFHREFD